MRIGLCAASLILVLPSCAGTLKTSPEHAMPTNAAPVADVRPHTVTLHGDTRIDNYHWLRDKGGADVTAYLEEENNYAIAAMKGTEPLQAALYDEIVARIQETDQSAPYRKGDFEYYHRTLEGKQYRVFCRRAPGQPDTEVILLDMNALAEDRAFLGLGVYQVSPDGRYLAYSLDETGFRDYTLQIKNLETDEVLPERIEKVKSFAWASDNRTFFYTVDDDTKRAYRVFRHAIGARHADALMFEEGDERFRVAVWRSRSGEYLFLGSFSHTTSEIRVLNASQPDGAWALVAQREQGHEYDISHRGDVFLIRTNDQGRNFRVVEAPVSSPGRTSWREVEAHRDDVMVEALDAFQSCYVLSERQDGLPTMRVLGLGPRDHRIAIEEAVYSMHAGINAEFASDTFRFRYESLTTPDSVFEYEPHTRQRTRVKQVEVLGDYDASAYESARTWATATDGTRIPVSLVFKKGTPRDGTSPLLLAGYGSYGYPYPTGFSHARVSLLDRGVTYAIAHVRGGGELGKPWHDQGRMEDKQNTFTDFIAVAEHLIAEQYTSADRLAIMGGSAGGLLMGAVANMRPDLFGVVVSLVPFVDVLNTMLDDSLPLTVGEYEEWGNPNERDAYFRIKAYCPYSNVGRHDYPTMLIQTSLNDSQVMYWEPAKYVAKLRAHKTDGNPLLFRTNMEAGHGGASGRYDHLKETAFEYAFILSQLPTD
ncbi:MAG: S9 family peptidase [Polyangiales bacterium]